MTKDMISKYRVHSELITKPLCLGGTNGWSHLGPDVLSMVVRHTYPVHPPDEVGSALWMCGGVDEELEQRGA